MHSQPQPGMPVVYVSPINSGALVAVVFAGLAVMLVVGLVIAFASHGIDALSRDALVGIPIVFDANGDGDDDALVMALHPGSEDMFVSAYEGTTGKLLWSSDALLRSGVDLTTFRPGGGITRRPRNADGRQVGFEGPS